MKKFLPVFFKRLLFGFCSFLVLIALYLILIAIFLPKEVLQEMMGSEESTYDGPIFVFLFISFYVSYFLALWFEGLLRKRIFLCFFYCFALIGLVIFLSIVFLPEDIWKQEIGAGSNEIIKVDKKKCKKVAEEIKKASLTISKNKKELTKWSNQSKKGELTGEQIYSLRKKRGKVYHILSKAEAEKGESLERGMKYNCFKQKAKCDEIREQIVTLSFAISKNYNDLSLWETKKREPIKIELQAGSSVEKDLSAPDMFGGFIKAVTALSDNRKKINKILADSPYKNCLVMSF